MIEDIIAVHIDDDISFEVKSVGEIRKAGRAVLGEIV